jgi:transcription antitermination factor NusG
MHSSSDLPGPRAHLDQHDRTGATPPALYVEPRWYACYTRARHEKQVHDLLLQRGRESYLPLVPQMRQWKDRKKLVEMPVFPSYVFSRFTLRDLHEILTIPGVSTIVRSNGYPTPIADREIENVRKFADALAETGTLPEVRPLIDEGDWVRINDGPFQGVEGIVIEQRGRRRVLVGLKAIGSALEIDIDTRSLRTIPPPEWATAR